MYATTVATVPGELLQYGSSMVVYGTVQCFPHSTDSRSELTCRCLFACISPTAIYSTYFCTHLPFATAASVRRRVEGGEYVLAMTLTDKVVLEL